MYLKTCKDRSVFDEFQKEIWPKEHLFESIHLYSLSVSCVADAISVILCLNSVWESVIYKNTYYFCDMLQDLLSVNSRTLPTPMKKLLKFGKAHIISCKICKAKGFVCEICRNPEVIFPFNLESIYKVREITTDQIS